MFPHRQTASAKTTRTSDAPQNLIWARLVHNENRRTGPVSIGRIRTSSFRTVEAAGADVVSASTLYAAAQFRHVVALGCVSVEK